jgi:antitoxin component of RelBE/YafQ-DinJ toxin-antitoxin module
MMTKNDIKIKFELKMSATVVVKELNLLMDHQMNIVFNASAKKVVF